VAQSHARIDEGGVQVIPENFVCYANTSLKTYLTFPEVQQALHVTVSNVTDWQGYADPYSGMPL
jgi:hypothetical protein